MVCTCSVVYMRAGIGNERLVVCLSEYLPLRIVYRISSVFLEYIGVFCMRAVQERRDHEYIESNRQYAMVSVMFVRLVLVFAATPKEMALQSVCLRLVLVFAATRSEMALRSAIL